jgi:hypothetical protein
MTKVVNFLKDQVCHGSAFETGMYSRGEIAGFSDEFADQMIRKGVVELYGDGVPRWPDGSPVTPKSGLARAKELMGEISEKIKG